MSRKDLGHVAIHDAQREPLGDGGLADARLADQHGVVLRAPRQNLDCAPDFLIAADDRVELALGRRLGKVSRIALQGIVSLLGRGAVRRAAFAKLVDRRVQPVRRDASVGENFCCIGALLDGERKQEPFDGDIAVARLLGDLLGLIEDFGQLGRDIELPRAGPRHFRHLRQRLLDARQRVLRAAASARDQARRQPFAVVEQNLQEVLRRKPLMPLPERKRLRALEKAFGTVG